MGVGHKRIARDGGSDDIFCGLPEHLLHSILECLPLRDAVRTSILARNWRYLWLERTNLVFDEEFFNMNFRSRTYHPGRAYTNLIYSILLFRIKPIHRFTLHIPNLYREFWEWGEQVDKWLLFLSRNGINELQLKNHSASPYKLPSCVFSCPSMKTLRIRHCLFKPPDTGCKLANLASLRFDEMVFAPEAYNCVFVLPMLTTLAFFGCTNIENFKVSAPELQYFAAVHCNDINLISLDKFCNLLHVIIGTGKIVEHSHLRKYSSFNLGNFFLKLPSVRRLDLDGLLLKLSAPTTIQGTVSFKSQHLTHLALHWLRFDDPDQISVALCALRSCPTLRRLDIEVLPFKGTALEPISSQLEAPDCLGQMLNLQRVEFVSYECLRPLFPLVKCILACSPSLHSMYFKYRFDICEEFDVLAELLCFPRASSRAKVIYSCEKCISNTKGTNLRDNLSLS